MYFSLKILFFFAFTISILKFSLYPMSFSFFLIISSFATIKGIPKPAFLNAIAAFRVFSSSPSAKTTFF